MKYRKFAALTPALLLFGLLTACDNSDECLGSGCSNVGTGSSGGTTSTDTSTETDTTAGGEAIGSEEPPVNDGGAVSEADIAEIINPDRCTPAQSGALNDEKLGDRSINGVVVIDRAGDGSPNGLDANDSLVYGVTVEAIACDGTVIDADITGFGGIDQFDGDLRSYEVRVPANIDVTIRVRTYGGYDLITDFDGNSWTSQVINTVSEDTDKDGLWSALYYVENAAAGGEDVASILPQASNRSTNINIIINESRGQSIPDPYYIADEANRSLFELIVIRRNEVKAGISIPQLTLNWSSDGKLVSEFIGGLQININAEDARDFIVLNEALLRAYIDELVCECSKSSQKLSGDYALSSKKDLRNAYDDGFYMAVATYLSDVAGAHTFGDLELDIAGGAAFDTMTVARVVYDFVDGVGDDGVQVLVSEVVEAHLEALQSPSLATLYSFVSAIKRSYDAFNVVFDMEGVDGAAYLAGFDSVTQAQGLANISELDDLLAENFERNLARRQAWVADSHYQWAIQVADPLNLSLIPGGFSALEVNDGGDAASLSVMGGLTDNPQAFVHFGMFGFIDRSLTKTVCSINSNGEGGYFGVMRFIAFTVWDSVNAGMPEISDTKPDIVMKVVFNAAASSVSSAIPIIEWRLNGKAAGHLEGVISSVETTESLEPGGYILVVSTLENLGIEADGTTDGGRACFDVTVRDSSFEEINL